MELKFRLLLMLMDAISYKSFIIKDVLRESITATFIKEMDFANIVILTSLLLYMVIVLLKTDSYAANQVFGSIRPQIRVRKWTLPVTGTILTTDLALTVQQDINGAITPVFLVLHAMLDSSFLLAHVLMFLLNVQHLTVSMELAHLVLSVILFNLAYAFSHKMSWNDLIYALSPARLVLDGIEDIALVVRFIMSSKEVPMENALLCFIDREKYLF